MIGMTMMRLLGGIKGMEDARLKKQKQKKNSCPLHGTLIV